MYLQGQKEKLKVTGLTIGFPPKQKGDPVSKSLFTPLSL